MSMKKIKVTTLVEVLALRLPRNSLIIGWHIPTYKYLSLRTGPVMRPGASCVQNCRCPQGDGSCKVSKL